MQRKLVFFAINLTILFVYAQNIVPAPSDGLNGKSNYFFDGQISSLQQVQVTITFDEDFTSENGASFQLNTYAQLGSGSPTVLQQLVFAMSENGQLNGFVEVWAYNQELASSASTPFVDLPGPTIPAGSQLIINLVNGAGNAITEATFTALIDGQAFQQFITLTDFESSRNLAVVSTLTVNIVGWENGETGQFTSGSGTIIYQSVNTLFPISSEPKGVVGAQTAEDGNVAYDTLVDSPATQITQGWQVT